MHLYAGPELGPLAGLMVGPEQGGWQVEEITVVSSRTGHVDRYLPAAVHSSYHPHAVKTLLSGFKKHPAVCARLVVRLQGSQAVFW